MFLKEVFREDSCFPFEELENLRVPNLPHHRLSLKVGNVVMLMTNLDKKRGLCNGTRLIVTKLLPDVVKVRRLVTFRGEREEISIPRLKMRSDNVPYAGTVERLQLPLRLAFAISIRARGRRTTALGCSFAGQF